MGVTYYELKNLKRRVDTQKLKVAALREQAVSLSQAADGLPHGGQVSDRVGVSVGQIIEEGRLNALYDKLTDGIKSVPDIAYPGGKTKVGRYGDGKMVTFFSRKN